MSSVPSSHAAPVVLLALAEGNDLVTAGAILADAGLTPVLSRCCREALRQVCNGQPKALLCDRYLPDGDWKDLISWLAESPEPPRVIVLAGNEPQFCAEAINLGAYDVLMRPLDADELRRVMLIACGVVAAETGSVRRAPARAMTAAAGGFQMGAAAGN